MRPLALALVALVLACTGTERVREPSGAPTSATTGAWTVVENRAALLDALAAAGTRPVVLDVSAKWCVPCGELRRSFADPRVVAALERHATIELDVTAQDREQHELATFFGADALPCVLRFDDAAALHEALYTNRREAAVPSLVLRTFVTPDELLSALAR